MRTRKAKAVVTLKAAKLLAAKPKPKAAPKFGGCAHKAGKANAEEYDGIIEAACKQLGWRPPTKECLVLAEELDSKRKTATEQGRYPYYFFNTARQRRRQWRHDYLFADQALAIEVEGISPRSAHNRHQSYLGYSEDCRKHNAISMLGYTLLRYTPAQLREGQLLVDLAFWAERRARA